MKSPISHIALASALAFGVTTTSVHAQTQDQQTSDPAPEDERVDDDLHNRQNEYQANIVVSAEGLRQLDLLAGTSVFESDDIQRNLSGQIGEVLTKVPGVSASSFSPGASRPVLRGFQGERVRVLVDGLGTSDVSNTSVDHATTIDPLTAERIEVLRGPAVLLYGSQAIGGAVNVIDKRIPTRVPDHGYHLDALAAADSVTDLRNLGASLDVPINSKVVFHVDGTWRQTGDLEIPGFQVSDSLRADLFADAADEEAAGEPDEAAELRDAANQTGFVPYTATESYTANAGLGVIMGGSNFGVSVGIYDTNYGVPTRPGAGHHGEDEGGADGSEDSVSIGLRQFRSDFRGDVELGDGPFSELKVRAGYSDYTHTEFEGAEVGTTFDVQSLELRAELLQQDSGPWRGSSGLQYSHRDFLAVGDEAYVPPNLTNQFALFTLQEFGTGPFQLEAAARYEATDVEASTLGIQRDFNTVSGAVSFVYEGDNAFRAGINLSRAERAPSAEELFSNGPHIATQAFEIGNPDLTTESAWGLEAFARGRVGTAEFNLAVFNQWFDNYIYLIDTGAEQDDLPEFIYLQQDAKYFGVEGEVEVQFADFAGFGMIADLRASYIRATLDDGSNVPRIPPLNLLGAIEAQSDALDLRGEVQWFAAQNDTAAFETSTDGFTLVNALASWRPLANNKNVTLQLAADNIFDVTGRRHASFTKDYVPLPGRNFRISVRVSI